MDLQLLQALGLDTEEGLAFCAGDGEFYEEMLGEYVTESLSRAAELEAFFTVRDWGAYRTAVHSLKSTSRMIGAQALSQRAKELESAAADKNEAVLLAGHGGFLRELRALSGKLAEALG